MKIAVLGTGMVGTTIGSKLTSLGHDVRMGSRKAGGDKAKAWVKQAGARASEGSFADAAAFAELVILCTNGNGAVDAVKAAGDANLAGKILVDITNPLQPGKGAPPSLSVCNEDSLGERVQKAAPSAKVVKTLNTVTAPLMIEPSQLHDGDHTMFLCGNDRDAKGTVNNVLLRDWLGWRDVVDLGDISQARGMEMYVPLWLRLRGALDTALFSVKVVRTTRNEAVGPPRV